MVSAKDAMKDIMKKLIVLDADGVLLNYAASYKLVWEEAFGIKLELKNPGMFHAYNEYGCPFEDDVQKQKFYDHFTVKYWESMPLLPDALNACNELVSMGYDLVCVTSMPTEFQEARQKNFETHNIPILKTYAVGRDRTRPVYSPKLEVLLELDPVAFVDDYATNFMDLHETAIHKALIHRGQPDSPNVEHLHMADSIHENLQGFVDYWK